MSDTPNPHALDGDYRAARERGRELVTLIKAVDDYGPDADPGGNMIRGQVAQMVGEITPLSIWLLIEVLARSVAATYDNLDDWSAAVIQAVADEDRP